MLDNTRTRFESYIWIQLLDKYSFTRVLPLLLKSNIKSTLLFGRSFSINIEYSLTINFYLYSCIFLDSDWWRKKFHVFMKQNQIKLHYFLWNYLEISKLGSLMHESFVTTAPPPPPMGNSGDDFSSIKALLKAWHCGDLLRVIALLVIIINSAGYICIISVAPHFPGTLGELKRSLPHTLAPLSPAHPHQWGAGVCSGYKWLVHYPNVYNKLTGQSIAIKTRDCEFMTGNQFPESESMRPVLGSLNLQINCKLPQIMYIS